MIGRDAVPRRVALIEAGTPGLHVYSHVAMGRGTPLLATVVRDAGFEVRAFVEDVSGQGSVDWGFVASAGIVGFSAITCTMPRTTDLIERTRAVNPGAVIVLGGPHPTCEPLGSLDAGADVVLRGEGEDTFPRLCAALTGSGTELETIEGLVWREAGAVRETGPPRQLTSAELDSLPRVDRSLVHRADAASVAWAWRARGCPKRCDFCEVCEIWPRYSARSVETTVAELLAAQDEGYPTAFLIDDNAAADKRSFKRMLALMAEGGFARTLVTQIRADAAFRSDGSLDREFLTLLRRAATVTVVCIGVESASDPNLAKLGKEIDSSTMARALRAMRRYGLVVHGMFIALAEDTAEVISRNGAYARRHVHSLQYLFEVPLPGTRRTREHRAAGRLLFDARSDLAYYDGMHVVLRPLAVHAAEMQKLVVEQYRRFYSGRRIVTAAVCSAFTRIRALGAAQRAYLRRVSARRRIYWWGRLHLEQMLAPVAVLITGHRRVKAFMTDPGYREYARRLDTL
ncbi:MAG: radical SAM protein [Anaerosomatales bacterium]|nr:radical SAM protein [Anaerosomatales bacterium]